MDDKKTILEKLIDDVGSSGEAVLRVKARVNAPSTGLRDIMADGTWKIEVAAVPEKGKANRELIRYLAGIFEVKRANIKILHGEKEKFKIIKILVSGKRKEESGKS